MAAVISAVVRCAPTSGVRPPGQMASSRRAISEWVCREISRELADRPSDEKERAIPNFLTPALPLARGGGGDRRWEAGLRSFRETVQKRYTADGGRSVAKSKMSACGSLPFAFSILDHRQPCLAMLQQSSAAVRGRVWPRFFLRRRMWRRIWWMQLRTPRRPLEPTRNLVTYRTT